MDKIIFYLVGILIIIVLTLLFTMYRGELDLLLQTNTTPVDAFRDYDVQKNFEGGNYYVEFKDLITSTGTGDKTYYRYDVTIQTNKKREANELIDIRKQVILLINGVMTTFKPSQLNTAPKRDRVKKIIQSEINKHYPDINIENIYFTNFLHG